MSDEAFTSYFENAVVGYAKDNIEAGRWPQVGAYERSRADFEESLPQGLQTPNNHLFEIVSKENGTSVGVLWFAVVEQHGIKSAFVYDIEIEPQYRRKGFAEAACNALESRVRELGLTNIGLHVFGNNMGAQALYKKLGFRVTGLNMLKVVDPTCAKPVRS
ncbi:MAG: GNAT family N-acetyltransferase [Planctomycetes bacterium]|nr:GNAT family N-acetyltransferase [Planctomycetota bacterium]